MALGTASSDVGSARGVIVVLVAVASEAAVLG